MPLTWGKTRRPLAASIAAEIDTLVLAGDIDNGSDGTHYPGKARKFPYAQFVRLTGLSHAAMRYHPTVIDRIQRFWRGESLGDPVSFHPIIEKKSSCAPA